MANNTAGLADRTSEPSSADRLNSWKEIAAYLKCSERTVRRWQEEGLPVRRHGHRKRAGVYAYKPEIDAWWNEGHARLAELEEAERARKRPWPLWLGATSVAVLLAAGIYLARERLSTLFPFQPVQALNESDYVLLADFMNRTGDPVFDGTLTKALAVKFGESPFLNFASDQKVRDTLRYMGLPADGQITAERGREICRRQGLKALIGGEIVALGHQYVLTLEAVNCSTGDSLARVVTEAAGKEEVLRTLGAAATQVRAKLGESLSSIQKFDTPIEQATTPSLDALKAYSVGWSKIRLAANPDAIPFLQQAIELDGDFAMAHAALGMAYFNLRENDTAIEYTRKAFERRHRASEREKLYITSHQYQLVEGDVEQARQIYQFWKQTYPRDIVPPTNLGYIYTQLGQFEKAAQETREALRLDPGNSLDTSNLAYDELAQNHFEEAKADFDQALVRNPDNMVAHYGRYLTASIQGDATSMARHVAATQGKPSEGVMLYFQAQTAAFSGHFQRARKLLREAADVEKRYKFKGRAANWEAITALMEAEFGNSSRAVLDATAALAAAQSSDARIVVLLALAACQDEKRTATLASDLAKQFPADTLINGLWLPASRAQIEINRGNPTRAIEILQAASPYELGVYIPPLPHLYAIYLRGQAYLAARQGLEAAAEFHKILDHRGIAGDSPLYSLAHLGLGRAYSRTGEKEKSHKAYEDFFALWKDADPDIPTLRQAKAEFAKLQ